jgi:membrane glycosyltransferase
MWAIRGPDYFASGPALFPTWPVWRPERVQALFAIVALVLFLPKLLGVVLALWQRRAASFGGAARLLRGVLLESVASALLAPIRMAFYCRFVVGHLLGRAVEWKGGGDERETTWRQALRRHGFDTAAACAWALGVWWLHPAAFWWLAPVAGALLLSVPLSALASRESLGARARSAGSLVTPEETQPPPEVLGLEAQLAAQPRAGWSGFPGAVVDPLRNAVHVLLSRGPRSHSASTRAARGALLDRALRGGPSALGADEKRLFLSDGAALLELHERVWRLEDAEAAARWDLVDPRSRPREPGSPR